jgi:hydrogenase expression/formation protein HypD
VELARHSPEELVFFATGFETTAVATAAALIAGTPPNFSVLSAHKYIPPAMELVAGLPGSRVDGFLAAGHAATITGWRIFKEFARRHGRPVVVAGFEPLDILAALARLVERVAAGQALAENLYPRCVTYHGNRRAQAQLWRVFHRADGFWRGIARIPGGDLRLVEAWAHVDARRRFAIDVARLGDAPSRLDPQCRCGEILTGQVHPAECPSFATRCTPDQPLGACMVSSEGACRIAHEYGDRTRAAL